MSYDTWPDDIFEEAIEHPLDIVTRELEGLSRKSKGRLSATAVSTAADQENEASYNIVIKADAIPYSQAIFGFDFSEALPYPVKLWAGKPIFCK